MKKLWLFSLAFFVLLPPTFPLAAPAAGERPEITPLRVVFVDVGHGDCIWIRTPFDGDRTNDRYRGYNIIIDGGNSSQRIVPLLNQVGFRWGTVVDWMILSHAHADHYRGLIGILRDFRVRRIVDPGYRSTAQAYSAFCWLSLIEPNSEFYSPVVGIATIPGLNSLGETIPLELDWGEELDVQILHSNPAVTDDTINLSSIVIRMAYDDVSFLFTGDIEGKYRPRGGFNDPDTPMFVEKFLLDRYVTEDNNLLQSTIIKVPHHGSETSSTNPFIRAVAPSEAVIQSGNLHGLPDQSVVERYEAHGARVWRTDRLDAGKRSSETPGTSHVIVVSDGTGYEITYFPDN